MSPPSAAGPLAGLKVVEVAGIGPGPYAAMLLADLGADVVRVDRPGTQGQRSNDPTLRNRRSITLDLKKPDAVAAVLRLVERSDVLLEGFRPGVAERLGIGPDICCQRNSRLVYARITGWGQEGPLARTAGHDINYIALSGLLHQIGNRGGKPVPPLNVVADYGGGGLMSGAAHFYDTYQTRDGKWLAVGAIEPQFHALLVEKLGLDPRTFATGVGFANRPYEELVEQVWPELKQKLAVEIAKRSRADLEELFAGTDACVTPVLSLEEAIQHPHNVARSIFIDVDGEVQNAPVPRFSRSTPDRPCAPSAAGQHAREILAELGYREEEITALQRGDGCGP